MLLLVWAAANPVNDAVHFKIQVSDPESEDAASLGIHGI